MPWPGGSRRRAIWSRRSPRCWRRRQSAVIPLVIAGLALLGGSIAAARRPTIPAAEQRVFRAVNGWPDWLYPILWLPMQLGNLVVGTIVGIVVVAALDDWWAIISVVVAMILKLVTERVIRRQFADVLDVRRRT